MPSGAEVIALSLKSLGVEHIFGIVGIPVIEVAEACISHGLHFYSFRNEQSAVYAASVYGYLTNKPGVCLVVGGPGVVHALAGVENANANRFPLLLLAGSSETSLRGLGAFQQLDQIALVRSAGAKFAEQPSNLANTPSILKQAYQLSIYGKPGTSYVDLPADLITASTDKFTSISLSPPPPPPQSYSSPDLVNQAALAIKQAKFPLLIVGKGSSWSPESVRQLQKQFKFAFLPTPMGKGVIPDTSPQNMSACRSAALKTADVVLVLGARLNWILHFGKPPKFQASAQFIQVTNVSEDICTTVKNIGLQGDVALTSHQLLLALKGWSSPSIPQFLLTKRDENVARAAVKEDEVLPSKQLQYQNVYKVIRETLEQLVSENIIYVSEGANTMDISRSSFPLSEPRCRLDAGTNATMGIGMGYAISAKVASPNSLVVAIEGDSAFGFSAMEVETAVRCKLPMIIYVMNNSGVYHGVDPKRYSNTAVPLPSTALSLHTRYHDLARSLGALGFEASTLEDVHKATVQAYRAKQVTVINVLIDPAKDKRLDFAWMSKI